MTKYNNKLIFGMISSSKDTNVDLYINMLVSQESAWEAAELVQESQNINNGIELIQLISYDWGIKKLETIYVGHF